MGLNGEEARAIKFWGTSCEAVIGNVPFLCLILRYV